MTDPLSVTLNEIEGVQIVVVSREVTIDNFLALRGFLSGLVDAGKTWIVVDIDELNFLDSTGLGVFLAVKRRLRDGHAGDLAIVTMHPQHLRTLQVVRFTDVDPDQASAVKRLVGRRDHVTR